MTHKKQHEGTATDQTLMDKLSVIEANMKELATTHKRQHEDTATTTQTLMDKLGVIKLNILVVMVHVLSLLVCATVVIGFLVTSHPLLMTVWLIAFIFVQYGITFNSIKLRKLYLYGDVYSDEDFF